MIYLTPWNSDIRDWPDYWGIMDSPRRGLCENIKRGRVWGGDNGAFTGKFDEDEFIRWLEKMKPYRETCKFIACPDVIEDPLATKEKYDKYYKEIKKRGFPVAFVGQDGQENLELPDEYNALFIGGSTEWKMGNGAKELIERAQFQNKWVHVGRVNSQMRINHFRYLGVDSVDGTKIQFGPDKNKPVLEKALVGDMLFDKAT